MYDPHKDNGNTTLLEKPQRSSASQSGNASRGSGTRKSSQGSRSTAKVQPISAWRRHRIALGVGVLVMALFVTAVVKLTSGNHSAPKREQMVVISLPPPPPPPPPQQPPPEPPKIVEQQQTFQPEEQPQEQPPEPPDAPPLGTNIQGDGKGDGFGLNRSGNGRLGGNGSNGTKFGWYAGQVQSRVQQAVQQNAKTRSANLRVQVRIWPDRSGRITRAELAGSTGDPGLDAALRNDVLNGLQLQQPPPDGMPLPIVMRVTARRP